MATLVLTTVGTMLGGPLGGAIEALAGQAADAAIFAPKGRKGPRLDDLRVQTSSYGSPLVKVFGRMRVAGTVIWASDLKEDRTRTGGGKGGPRTTNYSYSVSFAVALSGRPIARVGRIWADGKLLRGVAGDWKSETKFHLYPGDESQLPDPFIAAAEGPGRAPAYRGTAYAMFEGFQLADYGNRIPSLTFEVIADEGGCSAGTVIEALSEGLVAAGAGPSFDGYVAGGESLAGLLETLGAADPQLLWDDGERLRRGGDPAPAVILEAPVAETSRIATSALPQAVSLGYHDPARDYQAGLQRASRRSAGGDGWLAETATALPAAMSAGAAKGLAADRLDAAWAARERCEILLPYRYVEMRPGRSVRIAGRGDRRWRVTGFALEKMAVRLQLRSEGGGARPAPAASPGRSVPAPDRVHGATRLHLLDFASPERLAGPRLHIAAAGGAGWRQAELERSSDGGASWASAGATAAPATMGRALGVLPAGPSTLLDEASSVEVELLNEEMWLESRDLEALIGGANLAMLGDEFLQFGDAQALGGGRFRLGRLLRGRRGSEWAAASHGVGEPFTLVEEAALLSLSLPAERLGATLEVAARGIGDIAGPAVAARTIGVEALRPPSPVHLKAWRLEDGAIAIMWIRRSREGWGWPGGVDAPLGEEREAYRLAIGGGSAQRVIELGEPRYLYGNDAQAADGVGAGANLMIDVTMLGALAPSHRARLTITL